MSKPKVIDVFRDDTEEAYVTIVLYKTKKDILLAYAEGIPSFKKKKKIYGPMPDGSMWEGTIKEAAKEINKKGVWAFYRFKDKQIHLWFRKNVKEKNLQLVLAHEMGHYLKPHPRNMGKEELKAETYKFVTGFAYDTANYLLEEAKKGNLK